MRSYFGNFKKVIYDFKNEDGTLSPYTLPDLTIRSDFLVDPSSLPNFLDVKFIKDGDTPQSLSFELYGTIDHYWTIMYLNSIYDYYYDWPMKDNELQNYAEQLYPGKERSLISDNAYTIDVERYEKNQNTITVLKNQPNREDKRIIVGSYFIIGSSELQVGSMTEDNDRIYIIIADGKLVPETPPPGVETITLNFYDEIDAFLNIHHYETIDGVVGDRDYLISTGRDPIAVTNLDFLTTKNEQKRKINVVDPKYITEFSRQFKQSFRI